MAQNDSIAITSWVVGRDLDCDLVVQEPTVGGRHCRLTHRTNGFTIEDLGSRNGTFVNGVRIAPGEQVSVRQGALVTLGGKVEMPWPVLPNRSRAATVVGIPATPGAGNAGAGKRITIGRNPESDVPIDLATVSWNHAVITVEDGKYILEDLNSKNHTFIGDLHTPPIHRAVLDPSSDAFLGSYKIPASQLLSREKKKVAFPRDKSEIELGRDPQCDVPLDFPMISWRHARLTRVPNGMLVEDLGSRNGTYVDGVRVGAKVLVKPGQEIGLGSFRFELLAGGDLAEREYYGNVTIEAKDIVVNASNGKECLLNLVSLTVFPSELVAVMGPAGSGKTTLLKALNGYTRPVSGTVLFNGVDLYRYYDRFRQLMGYVPQDDIVHPQLTVREALYFSARLRTDLTDAEIDTRTRRILKELDIADKIDKMIGSPERKVLSGGQRKRVNIALELITDTPVLFLDEPTSGLSSYDAESVIDLLKGLSKAGKTVITTIHQPSLKVYRQFDDLIMICRDKGEGTDHRPGAMVYFGPAYPDSIQFFNPPFAADSTSAVKQNLSPEMLESGMNIVPEAERTETWRQRYLKSQYQAEFVATRSGKNPASRGKTGEENARRRFGFMQWFALVKRNLIVKLRDRAQTSILLLQAPFLAALICVIAFPLDKNDFPDLVEKLVVSHFLMVVAAIWFGCNNAARDIVGEWTIYRRERMVTLKLLPYIFSKLAVLLALCIFQCGVMLGIVYFVCGFHGNFPRDFLVLLVASMIGAGLGLCISAVSKTSESAIALLPVVLLPIIALAGGIRPIYRLPLLGRIVSVAVPSRWAFEANLLQEAAAREWMPAVQPQPSPPQPPLARCNGLEPLETPHASPNAPEDLAQHNLPSYVIPVHDDKGEHLCPAPGNENPYKGSTSTPVKYRHSFRDSMAVLGLMLALSVAAVILILLRRDSDPQ